MRNARLEKHKLESRLPGEITITSDMQRRRQWRPTPVLLPGKSHGWRSLVGCSAWSCEESDTTERLHFHFSLSCIGEGNGNPLQCSCLENPRDGGAWWAVVSGVTQSRTRLKWLSSSSSLPSAMAHTLSLLVECVSLWINPLLTSHFVSHQVLNKVCNLSLKDHRFKSQYELHGFMRILEAGCPDIFDLCSPTAKVWFWRTQAFL